MAENVMHHTQLPRSHCSALAVAHISGEKQRLTHCPRRETLGSLRFCLSLADHQDNHMA